MRKFTDDFLDTAFMWELIDSGIRQGWTQTNEMRLITLRGLIAKTTVEVIGENGRL